MMNMASMKILQTVMVGVIAASFFFDVGLCSKSSMKDINTDKSALLTLKSKLIINPSNSYSISLESNWSSDSLDVCSWIGVSCGDRHHRVTGLNLSYMGLGGVLPPHLGNLSFLRDISLSYNSFHGSIPSELFILRRLEHASFLGNQFTGPIPSNLFSAPSLRGISFENNFLSGSIPTVDNTSFSSPLLQFIGLTYNNLTGELPEEIFHHLPHLIFFGASYNMLTGQIPSSLFGCRLLQVLSLSFNHLGGSIPPQIGNLSRLTDLYLAYNNLAGAIPSEIAGLINSEYIVLENNALTGSIPSEIGGLIYPEYINLENNALTGEIPPSITNLTRLIVLNLGWNNLSGLIHQHLWNHLQNLQSLSFQGNHLNGPLPHNIFNISSLEAVSFSMNQFSGSLPSSLGINLPNLQKLQVAVNFLSGAIPTSLSNSSKLETLDMTENNFSGTIPNELGSLKQLQSVGLALNNLTMIPSFFTSMANCKSLTSLQLSVNPLNTILPSSIGNLSTTLLVLLLHHCQLKGAIPLQFGYLENLVTLELQANRLSGTIPTTLGALQNIQSVSFADNILEGPIPHDICKLSHISYIYLDGNAFNGSIPTCLGNLSTLRELYMSRNRLSMEVPSSLWNLVDIQQLDLSWNSLSGHLPKEIGNLKAAILLSLSHNQFIGNIPPTLRNLINLQNLSFANNKLYGFIPKSLGDLISLQYLDLSSNNLSGVIPNTLEKLSSLEYFNVSANRLEGEIPDGGPFTNLSAQSFILNGDLCGSPRFEVPRCKTVAPRKKKAHMPLIREFIIPMISVVSIVVFVLLVLILKSVRRRKMNNVAHNVTEMVPLATWRRVSYYELVQATNQFHESNLLGSGAFGSVFKGTLSDGMNIAIKVFNQNMGEAFESFHNECEVMRSIRHMNLVKVITSCSSPDLKCLIMEYMPNGSLEKWLYDTDNLNILQRLSIVIDVAKALEYLHHGHSVPVIHCDLKPSNVLLDEDMVAHVTDFGISKLLTGGDSITQTLTLATFGYTAPEYGLEGIVSSRGDVYSYGIILMETFVGKRPTDDTFASGMSLPQWVKKSLPHNVHEVVDFRLLNIEDHHFEKKIVCISEIMKLALECCSEKREDRPRIIDISTKLKKMNAKLLHDPRFIP